MLAAAAAAEMEELASAAAPVHFAEDRGQAVFAELATADQAASHMVLAVLDSAAHTEVDLVVLVHTLQRWRLDQA